MHVNHVEMLNSPSCVYWAICLLMTDIKIFYRIRSNSVHLLIMVNQFHLANILVDSTIWTKCYRYRVRLKFLLVICKCLQSKQNNACISTQYYRFFRLNCDPYRLAACSPICYTRILSTAVVSFSNQTDEYHENP